MTTEQFFILFTIGCILLFATPWGRKVTKWMETEKEIVCGVVGIIVFSFQAYVMIGEYSSYLPLLPVLWCGVVSFFLAAGCFAYTLKTMWNHGYRPIWYR